MARIIAMDEVGKFEKRDSGIRFIGGFINDIDYELAKNHMETFLINICEEADKSIKETNKEFNVVYPRSLHGSGAIFFRKLESDSIDNWEAVPLSECNLEAKKFKYFIQTKVMEYLKERSYKLFLYLDPYTGGGYDDEGSGTNITDANQGANRYERMALQSIYSQIFYSFDTESDEYIFELPTRTLELKELSESAREMYWKNNGKVSIMGTSTFKTAIATMLYEKGIDSNANYKFKVSAINYDEPNKPTTPYTYVADIVCTYLRGLLQRHFCIGKDTTSNKITSHGLIELLNQNAELDLNLYVYSEADSVYRKMVECVKKCELVKCFEYLYTLKEQKEMTENYKEFYFENWIKKLDEEIKKRLLTSDEYKKKFRCMVDEYIATIEGYMGIKEIAYEKGLYIAQKFVELINIQENWERKNWALFRLYDIILRGYNHRGSVEKAKEYAQKCDIYKAYISVEEYVSHILRMVVYYSNNLNYKKSLDVALQLEKIGMELENNYQAISSVCDDISSTIIGKVNPVHTWQSPLVGKIYSNLGQAYAFINDFENSKKAFEVALKKFSKHSDNYKITMSYYLHLLIENNELEQYEREVVNYLGEGPLEFQLQKAFEYNSFAILVFIKAFSRFYVQDHANLEILEKFERKISTMDKTKRSDHPWELIYMHLSECLLSIDWDDEKGKIYYRELAEQYGEMCWYDCNKHADTTIILIQLNAQIRFMKLSGRAKTDGVLEGFREQDIYNCEKILGLKQPITYSKLRRVLDEKLTYMYK